MAEKTVYNSWAMPINVISLVVGLGALALGTLIGSVIAAGKRPLTLGGFEQKANNKLEKTQEEADRIYREAGEKAEHLKVRSQEDEERLKEQFVRIENLIVSKEEQVEKKEQRVQSARALVDEETKQVDALREGLKAKKIQITESLSRKVGIRMDKAKEEVLEQLARDLELMKEERIHKLEEYLQEEKIGIAKNMIVDAIQRYSAPTSVEKKSLAVMVDRDEHKARIIGQNAENLILIEELTGCDIIFNDAPGTIIISCFDLVKKHIARELVMKLLREKFVDASVINIKLEEAKKEIERSLIRIGKETVKKLELDSRAFNDDFYRIVGRLQFRTSYGQNILKHSFEVGYFTLMLGSELGLNMETCKVGGFFHDLGKAIDHEVGEPHDILSKRIMEEHKCFSDQEIHAAWAHHDAVPQETAEAMLVKAGDAISAGRPGARQETLEKYIERIRAIEGIANSYEGVSKTYAISAGRELRVIVEPAVLEDENLSDLATHIAREIEENVAYPGKIKVNVIRRTQSIDVAKPK
ncbi:MAG TPA: Rnase Y domain-containing protein [Candidatus Gracilibacteria bacterium]|nr:Rnase Y domain-containing protein [Candidatus Gracilibacteria bacterium]